MPNDTVRVLKTFIIHYICTKLKIFAQICFGLQISILALTSLVSAIVEGVLRTTWNTKIHHRVHKRPPFVPIPRQMSPGHRLPHFFNTPTLSPSHLCISVPSGQYPSGFPTRTLSVSLLPCACHMPRPSHPLFHPPNISAHVIQLEIGRRFCLKKKKR